jgi:hypothetical protein
VDFGMAPPCYRYPIHCASSASYRSDVRAFGGQAPATAYLSGSYSSRSNCDVQWLMAVFTECRSAINASDSGITEWV